MGSIDQKYAGRAKSTVFLASPHPAVGLRQRLIQIVIDPSYKLDSALFLKLKDILYSFECELGIHGSFHSLTQGSLKREKETLEKAMACEIHSVRQHWLHLPGEDPIGAILSAGLTYDSTLGWNGRPGFRGGFGRPFPLLSATGNKIWELPLVVMDGPLFFDMKLSTSEVVATATSILQEVHDRGGYHLISEAGPAHEKEFFSQVVVGDKVLGIGKGKTKKEAEQMAAEKALKETE